MSQSYFLTEKMYAKPSYVEYEKNLDGFLKKIPGYCAQSGIEKWQQICGLFSKFIPSEKKAKFKDFVLKRINSSNGVFVLPISEFTLFIEHFYFLMKTTDARFKPSEKQKENVLKTLEEIYENTPCEAGIVTRLNDSLLQCRTDENWMISELLKQRHAIVHQMSDEYNELYAVSGALSIHTLMHMNRLANEKNFGVCTEASIDDVFLSSNQDEQIASYFEQVVFDRFKKSYEQNFIDGLMTHLWSEFNRDFVNEAKKTGQDYLFEFQYPMQSRNHELFKTFIENYFGAEADTSSFYAETDNPNVYKLVSLEQLKLEFKKTLSQKLEREGFLIPFDKITKATIQDIRLAIQDQSIEQKIKAFLMLTFDKEQFNNNFREYLKCCESASSNCPEIFAYFVCANPDIWDFLPLKSKNNIAFIKQIITQINAFPEEKFRTIAQEILEINPEYFYKFTAEQREHLKDHLGLMSEDAIKKFRTEYRKVKTTGSHIYDIFRGYSTNVSDNDTLVVTTLPQNLKSIKQKKQLTLFELSQHISLFNPAQLLEYLKTNDVKVHGLSKMALKKFVKALKGMSSDYEKIWNTNGYLAVKVNIEEKILKKEIPVINSDLYFQWHAKQAIEKHSNWLYALIDFQQMIPVSDIGYSSVNPFQKQLYFLSNLGLQILKIALQFSKIALKLGFFILILGVIAQLAGLMWLGLDYLLLLITPWILVFFILAVAQIIRNIWISDNSQIEDKFLLFLQILSVAIFPLNSHMFFMLSGLTVLIEILSFLIIQISKLTSNPVTNEDIKNFFRMLWVSYFILSFSTLLVIFDMLKMVNQQLLSNLPKIIFSGFYSTFAKTLNSFIERYHRVNDLETCQQKIEDNIWRLTSIDDISAQQKAKILKQIWHHLQQEEDVDLKQALDQPFPFSFKGQQYQLSFKEVSAIKRTSGQEICLEKRPKDASFFSSTSKKVLDDLSLESKSLKCN